MRFRKLPTLKLSALRILAFLVLQAPAEPSIEVPRRLGTVLEDTDAIVIASAEWQPRGPSAAGAIRLTVEEAVQGPLQPGARLSCPTAPLLNALPGSVRGLFFLRRGPEWQLVPFVQGQAPSFSSDVFYFIPPGPLPSEFRLSTSLPIEDRIFLLLVWADSRRQTRQFSYHGMLLRKRIDLDFPPGKRSPLVSQRLAQMATDADPREQVLGVRAQLQAGDLVALAKLGNEHQRLRANPAEWRSITRALQSDLPPVPGAGAVLGSLVNVQSDASLRTAAAIALARIHNRETLPHLARLLDDPDPEIRAYAVGGLAMFANNVPIGQHHPAPGDWPFRTSATMAHSAMSPAIIEREPAKYLGFWKAWWRDNQAAAMASR